MLCCALIAFVLWPLGLLATRFRAAAGAPDCCRPNPWPYLAGAGAAFAVCLLLWLDPWVQAGARSADQGFRHFCIFAASLPGAIRR